MIEVLLILSAPLWPVVIVVLAERLGLVRRYKQWRGTEPRIDPDKLDGYTLREEPAITDIAHQAALRADQARARAARLGLHRVD